MRASSVGYPGRNCKGLPLRTVPMATLECCAGAGGSSWTDRGGGWPSWKQPDARNASGPVAGSLTLPCRGYDHGSSPSRAGHDLLSPWDNVVVETGLLVVLCLLWNIVLIGLGIGRRRKTRPPPCTSHKMYAPFTTLVLFISTVLRIAEACSSRSTPKPRPPSSTLRPNITFPTYACPPAYATWYCLNGATCFTVEISESILYNCVCADGYTGPRCEFKDLDGSYLPSREKILVEKASIASGVTIAVLLIVIISISFYIYSRRRKKEKAMKDVTDSGNGTFKPRPFSSVRSQRHSFRNSRVSRQSDVEAGSAGCNTGIQRDPALFSTHANSNAGLTSSSIHVASRPNFP